MGIDYKDEEEVKSAYNFVKGENGELSDDLLESASGGARSKIEELDPNKVVYNDKHQTIGYRK